MNHRLITRFAPSPTGYLHRGHALSALWVWAAARVFNCTVLLRIEDHDRSRSRPEYISAIREDLHWLGFRWDAESVQSENETRYRNALKQLQIQGLVYACNCSRRFLLENNPGGTEEIRYTGHCRDKALPFSPGNAIRVRIADECIAWQDIRLGSFTENPAEQCGDVALLDRTGQWTYQFAVCVDDMEENIGLVVRGEDLRASTARQIILMRTLGKTSPPLYLHHPLLLGAAGQKLSKRQHDASLRGEREKGISPEALFGEICHAAGLTGKKGPLPFKNAVSLVAGQIKKRI